MRVGPADAAQWKRMAVRRTDTTFAVLEATLSGRLIEPVDAPSERPLVVMIQGSERTSALDSSYALALAAQGLSVFVYDKRGAGSSTGEYTQNFALLAEDAVAALAHARTLAAGRFGRSGYFGASQGGWVAPLAATRTKVDFVAVAYGLVASPIEEDHAQLVSEARALGVEAEARPLIDRLSRATATLLRSRFQRGYGELARVRRALAERPWGASLAGEYSGAMVRSSEDSLRRLGVARFANLELIWDYDAKATLLALDTPLLWVLAEEDREAPIEGTQRTLRELKRRGKPITVYAFPDTDHGMFEFTESADKQRTMTRITDGYLRLVGDWVRGDLHGEYGRGRPLTSALGE